MSEADEIAKDIITEDEIKTTVNALKDKTLEAKILKGLTGYNQSKLDKLNTQAENIFLHIRNRLKYVSFPREGSVKPPPEESSKVRTAMELLRGYNEDPTLIKTDSDLNKILDATKDLFWYPKVPDDQLIDLQKHKKAWNEKKKRKKYLAGTKPRTNDFNILCHVTAFHIDTIASCFPAFREPQYYDKFIKGFVEKVAGDWGMTEYADFLTKVKALVTSDEKLYVKEQKKVEEKMAAIFPENIPIKPTEVTFSQQAKGSNIPEEEKKEPPGGRKRKK